MSKSGSPISTNDMIPIDGIEATNIEYVDEVLELSRRATEYIGAMPWCRTITRGWLAYGCGYILGVFYFHIVPARQDVPQFHWVVVGDLPPAYLATDCCGSSDEVLGAYVCEMQEWVDRVMDGRVLTDDIIPVNVPADKKWAKELQGRLDFIRKHVLGEVGIDPNRGRTEV